MLVLCARIVAYTLALASLGLGALLYRRLRTPLGLVLWFPKIVAGSLAGVLAGAGALGALLGALVHALPAVLVGALGALLCGLYVWRVMRRTRVRANGCGRALPAPVTWRQRLASPAPRWERDVAFGRAPGCARPLLCDIWRPPAGVRPSGVAIVYCHSSAWHLADKDVWTRPLFRHLAGRGHVVMDVGYRLCPEVGLQGMLSDARRAIAWMRANASRLGADPARIVAAGASAGGHLALLAAYTAGNGVLTPPELQGIDTSVQAVISCYGVTDLRAFCRHIEPVLPGERFFGWLAASPLLGWAERVARLLPGLPVAGQLWKLGKMSRAGLMASLLGDLPHGGSAALDLGSPITYVGAHCPPTLLIQGEHDLAIPLSGAQALAARLAGSGVAVTQVVLPNTDHMYDLLLPQVSPAARVALAHLDRFLAQLM